MCMPYDPPFPDGQLILEIVGVDEPAALHGGLPQLPRGLPP